MAKSKFKITPFIKPGGERVFRWSDALNGKGDRSQAVLRGLWETRQGCISFQVLQEFHVTTTRNLNPRLSCETACREVNDLLL